MKQRHDDVAAIDSVDEQTVAQYLREHPEFFVGQSELLAELKLPHKAGNAISLVERQIAVLREQNTRYHHQLKDLIQIARDNDRLNDHLQALTLKFFEHDDINQVLILLNLALCNDFSADAVTLFLMMDEGGLPLTQATMEPLEVVYLGKTGSISGFEAIIADGQPYCGQFDHERRDALFGLHADIAASAVVLPMYGDLPYGNKPIGLLAIGSQQPDRYHSNMGTVFLKYLAELLSRTLWPYVES